MTVPDRSARRDQLRAAAIIILLTFAAHFLCLFDGKVLDDFWHQKGLREHGWSFSELMHTLVIRPSDFLETWWQQNDFSWHYLRPFFILCMKTVFLVLGGGDPFALHLFSILLHLTSAILVWRLALRLTENASCSLVAGVLFGVYPHSIITVAWPSSQNVVIQTTLLLATIFAYLRASALDVRSRPVTDPVPIGAPPLDRPALAMVFGLWLLAMFTRENAVLLPAVLGAFELAFGGWRRLWARRALYATFGVIAVAFIVWREWMRIPPLPDVYARRPAGDWGEYLPWLAAKFLHYITASIWPAPMSSGPTGRYNPWTEVPGDCALMIAIIAGLGTIYWLSARRLRGWWIWPMWIALSILPVAAVVATPHSGYMSGVGFALAAGLAPAAALRFESRRIQRWAIGTTTFLLLGMGFMCPVNRLQWVGIFSAERYLPGWILCAPPPREATDVFLLNMPLANIYIKPNLVDRLGPDFEKVRVHVLTYAPQAILMDQRTTIEQLDDHTFTLAVEGQAYFSRLLGRFLLAAFRGPEPFVTGQEIDGRFVRVKILRADSEGVWKLQFTLPRPLADQSYCFYLASADCGAARVRFRRQGQSPQARERPPAHPLVGTDLVCAGAMLEAGHARWAEPLFATVMSAGPAAREADELLRPPVRYMATALGAPIQALLDRPTLTGDEWRSVQSWWNAWVDDQAMRETWLHRTDFDDLIYLRAEIEWDRFLAGFIFRSDLYLTGPPYSNPRPAARPASANPSTGPAVGRRAG